MTDFATFRSKLADAVLVAINSGTPIGDNCCPMGVRTLDPHEDGSGRPDYPDAAQAWGITSREAEAFGMGFDGCTFLWETGGKQNANFYELGVLYKKLFSGAP